MHNSNADDEIINVNATRSGIKRLPEQMPLEEKEEREMRAKNSIDTILSEEFKGLIDKVDNYLVLMTEDFGTARLIFAHQYNYETNMIPELAFLGYAYAISKGKNGEIWVQEGRATEFAEAYREFMKSFRGRFHEPKIVKCNGWQKSLCDVVKYGWKYEEAHRVDSARADDDDS